MTKRVELLEKLALGLCGVVYPYMPPDGQRNVMDIMKRYQQETEEALELRFVDTHVEWRGRTIPMTPALLKVLRVLWDRRGQLVTTEEIYSVMYRPGWKAGGDGSGSEAARTVIKRIREAFKAIDPEFDAILTRPGYHGYTWRVIE